MKNHLEHKGYVGSIQFSVCDKVYFGKIQAIRDLVSYEAANVVELERSFIDAVEDFLLTCEELGKEV